MKTAISPFTSPRLRHLNGLLLSLVTAIICIPGLSTYLPLSVTDKIGVPIFMFPFIWVGLFMYSYMSERWYWPMAVMMGLNVVHVLLIVKALSTS